MVYYFNIGKIHGNLNLSEKAKNVQQKNTNGGIFS